MVVPMGPPGLIQNLWRITKVSEQLKFANLGVVMFVPLVRLWGSGQPRLQSRHGPGHSQR